ncbi:uncharacterized protein N7529_007425 [Penicillium soppii]|uniref:uncharacterized protein n=1 Tax=Penicillium soppii TaxID=69789 RepID=UPI002547AB12|nr:uncharacterized protein N7529_007425 [Penicillium soppii]KAJ5860115.1 hypothetical protein N7529_007425 [Penicillium soppii]
MENLTKWFKKPPFPTFSKGDSNAPEKKESEPATSPLTSPPSSFVVDNLSPKNEQDAEDQLKMAIHLSSQGDILKPPAWDHSFQSVESGSFSASQRIVKNGKEMDEPVPTKIKQVTSPKKWKYDLNYLVTDAVDDQEVERNVAQMKAKRAPGAPQGPTGARLNESALVSALGSDEDGSKARRTLGAIRRTEALDHDRTWLFFDATQTLPPAPEFPLHLIPRGAMRVALKDPAGRDRLFVSGEFVYMALAKRLLPDEVILWMFHSVPFERRDELSNAYGRILEKLGHGRLEPLIRPADVNEVFGRLGANKDALDPSKEVTPMDHYDAPTTVGSKDHVALISVLKMFRKITRLLADDTKEQIILLLLRLTLDVSLTTDSVISSELQWAICDVLDPANSRSHANNLSHRVCTTFYNTVQDVCLQSRMCHHMLPTSLGIALLRGRLAISFLLESPEPLVEPPGTLLDLQRITDLLTHNERFQVKRFQGKFDYDWRELIALTALLNIAIDSSVLDLNYRESRSEQDFNADLDKLANQIKILYCSIQVSGASHMTLTLAKGDLEALHYRILYSVRSKPPPKKTLFTSYAKEDGDIRSIFSKYNTKTSDGDGSNAGRTGIPIR